MVQRKRKLTDRIPQPVGMKANIEANMSGKDVGTDEERSLYYKFKNKRHKALTKEKL